MLLSKPGETPKIWILPDTPDRVIFALLCVAVNLNQAELFCAAFQLQPIVFPLNISEDSEVSPLFVAIVISSELKQRGVEQKS